MTSSEPLIPLTAYCRTSTDDQQNPEESLRWQLSRASALIVGRAQIVSVTHDTDVSRSVPWPRRPEAARLIAQLPNPARGWTGIVVGEPQRAFGSAGQVQNILPQLAHWGVQLWVPEVGGPVDPESEAHDLLMSLFGGLSKAERNRLRVRVRTSMKAMAPEGRYLGGRPPYGYQLVRTGVPHPNPEKARQGIQLTNLAVDPETSKVVRADLRLAARGRRLPDHRRSPERARVPLPLRGRPGAKPAPSRSGLVARRGPSHRHEPQVQGAGRLRALPQGRTPLRRQRPRRRQRHPDVPGAGLRGGRDGGHRARNRERVGLASSADRPGPGDARATPRSAPTHALRPARPPDLCPLWAKDAGPHGQAQRRCGTRRLPVHLPERLPGRRRPSEDPLRGRAPGPAGGRRVAGGSVLTRTPRCHGGSHSRCRPPSIQRARRTSPGAPPGPRSAKEARPVPRRAGGRPGPGSRHRAHPGRPG